MADEPENAADATTGGETGGATEVRTFTQEELDKIISARIAREREKLGDVQALQKELEQLRQEQKKRKEAEMSELEKANTRLQELELEISELKPFKETVEARNTALRDKVEKEREGLSDDDQQILSAIKDPEAQLTFIRRAKNSSSGQGVSARQGGGYSPAVTLEEVYKIRDKFGERSQKFRDAWKRYKEEKAAIT